MATSARVAAMWRSTERQAVWQRSPLADEVACRQNDPHPPTLPVNADTHPMHWNKARPTQLLQLRRPTAKSQVHRVHGVRVNKHGGLGRSCASYQ